MRSSISKPDDAAAVSRNDSFAKDGLESSYTARNSGFCSSMAPYSVAVLIPGMERIEGRLNQVETNSGALEPGDTRM